MVVTDGYQVYHKLAKEREDLAIAGCWVHARRPFAEMVKSDCTEGLDEAIAKEACSKITEIMHIDNGFDSLSASERQKQREDVLTKKVDAYFAWAKEKYSRITHNGKIGKALAYSINQEEYLRRFLTDGEISMDNNYAEQAIRPFTIGRKNFVLIESSNGAKASAIIYSLMETAKANRVNTYQYMELLRVKSRNTWMIPILISWRICFPGPSECRRNAPANFINHRFPKRITDG